MYLGSQVKDNKSLLKSINDVIINDGNVVQVFLRKMHSSSVKDKLVLTNNEIKEIKNFIKKNKIKGYVHASYLLNFCKVPEGLLRIQWAYNILKDDMELGEKLGMKGVVIHMCSRNAVDEKWNTIVDIVIDGGYGDNTPSTVVDLSEEGEVVIIREGKGSIEDL